MRLNSPLICLGTFAPVMLSSVMCNASVVLAEKQPYIMILPHSYFVMGVVLLESVTDGLEMDASAVKEFISEYGRQI